MSHAAHSALGAARVRRSSKQVRPAGAPLLVAIAGGSGSGKSWLADKLQSVLGPKVLRISLDSFYRDRSGVSLARRARINFDHPRAIDWTAVEQVLDSLLNGREAELPVYDFKTHSRVARLIPVRPRPLILLEGLWALRRRNIRERISFSVFLHCPTSLRLQRRLARDAASRGRTSDSVRRQFRDCVEPMHQRYVEPQAKSADLVLNRSCRDTDVSRLAERLQILLKES